MCAVATFGGGSVKFETLGPDGSTYLPVNSATSLTANGCGNTYAAPGQFEIVIATATAVYVSIGAIPQ